jgi:hypothetical protein
MGPKQADPGPLAPGEGEAFAGLKDSLDGVCFLHTQNGSLSSGEEGRGCTASVLFPSLGGEGLGVRASVLTSLTSMPGGAGGRRAFLQLHCYGLPGINLIQGMPGSANYHPHQVRLWEVGEAAKPGLPVPAWISPMATPADAAIV